MATAKSGLKRFYVALGVLLGAGIALSWYYFGWVASRREYFRKRDFRQLTTLSGQIQQKVDNFDNIMDHFRDSTDRTSEGRANYFSQVGSDLEYQEKRDLPRDVQDMKANDPPSLAIERDEGEYRLFFALADPQNPSQAVLYTWSSVEKLISPFALPLRSTFEAILVARCDGTVIFQRSSGNEVLNIRGLEKARGEGKIDVRTLHQAAMSTEVKLAGANYTLYSQPIRLSYPSWPGNVELPCTEPADQGRPSVGNKTQGTKPARNRTEGNEPTETTTLPEAGTKGLEVWIVCVLVRSDRFNRDSLAISSTAVLGFVVALLFIFFLSPFIKLSLLRPKERLRARDGVLLATSTFLGTALFAFVLLDAYYYGFRFHHEMDEQLKSVAQSMQDNLNAEEGKIWEQLDKFDTTVDSSPLAQDLHAINTKEGRPRCHPQHIDGQDPYVCERTNILGDKGPGPMVYPYLNFVFWDDDGGKGMQRIKWTFQEQVTPFLTESDMPYFADIKKEARWLGSDYPSALDVRGIDSVYSVNSGKNIAIYWKLEEPDCTKRLSERCSSPRDSQLLSASLVARPVSLIGPVLPAGYQFAVVNKDGLVLFHSDATKNLIENFFAECDDNDELRSLVSTRASDSLSVYYAGRRQRLYVRPLQHKFKVDGPVVPDTGPKALRGDSLWSLVVFEDMLPAETMNSEALTTSSILFVVYAGILVIFWTVIHGCWQGYPRKWFWPNEKKAGVYHLVALLNSLISILLFVCILRAAPGTVVLAGFLIPALALALTFLLVNYQGGERAGREGPSVEDLNVTGQARASGSLAVAWQRLLAFFNRSQRPRWEASHAWARVSLLIVVAVLPCFAFFAVSFDFEKMLLINRGQDNLINRLHERQEQVRSEYQSISLSRKNEKVLLDRTDDQLIALSEKNGTRALDRNDEDPPGPLWLALGKPDGQAPGSSAPAGTAGSYRAGGVVTTLARVGDRDPGSRSGAGTGLTGDQRPPSATSEPCFGEDLQWVLAAARPHYNEIAGQTESLITQGVPRFESSPEELPVSGKTVETGKLQLHLVAGHPEEPSPSEPPPVEKVADNYWDCSQPPDQGTPQLALTRRTQDLNGDLLVSSEWEPSRSGLGNWWAWLGLAPLVPIVLLFVRLGEKIFLPGLCKAIRARPDDQEFFDVIAEFKRKVSAANEKARQEMARFFHEECGPTPELRAIAEQFVSHLPDTAEITREEIVLGIQDLGEAYYRTLWGALSKQGKLLLAQLAHEGLVNPKNHVLVAQLMKKGLIARDPSFRLMNRSFTRFVISALPPHTMDEWETEGVRLPWKTLKFVLLTAVASLGIFLYLTQQSLFESVAAYVGAIAAAIPALIRLVGIFQGAPAGGTHAE